MARLPVVNGDEDNWGSVLVEFLQVEHDSDGTLKRLKRFSYDVVVYIDSGSVIARDYEGDLISSGTAGTDDYTVLTAAQDNASGLVVIMPGTYTLSNTLLIKNPTIGLGIGKTILKLGNNVQKTVIEMENKIFLSDLTIDGNYANNLEGESGWSGIDDVPVAHGIMTGKYWHNSESFEFASDVILERIYIKNTLRSCLSFMGDKNVAKAIWLENSYTDHLLYISHATNSLVEGVFAEGMAENEAVSVGWSENNTVKHVYIHDLESGKWNYPTTAFIDRDTSAENWYENIRAVGASSDGVAINFSGEKSIARNISVETRGDIAYAIYVCNSDVILKDFYIKLTADDRTDTAHALYIRKNCRVMDGYIECPASSSHWRGININPLDEAISDVILRNISVDCHADCAVRVNGSAYDVSWDYSDLYFLDKSNFNVTGTVKRLFKNSGSATITNGNTSVTVNHGLVDTPSNIRVTGAHSEVKDAYVTNVGTTSFDINVGSAVSANRTVYWKAEV